MFSKITHPMIALRLTFIYLVLELFRAFLDSSFIFPDYSGGDVNMLFLFAAIYTALFTIWLIGISNAKNGKRSGFVTALVIGLFFFIAIDISTVLFYCPGGCDVVAFDVLTWTSLIVGAVTLIGLGSNLRSQASK